MVLAFGLAGVSISLLAVSILATPLVYSETRRREQRGEGYFAKFAAEHHIRGRVRFQFGERPPPPAIAMTGFRAPLGSYNFDSPEDGEKFRAAVGRVDQLEDSAHSYANAMRWTDRRFALVGLAIAFVGATLSVIGLLT